MPLFDVLSKVDGRPILWAAIMAGNTTHAREIMESSLRENYREANGLVLSVTPTKDRRDVRC